MEPVIIILGAISLILSITTIILIIKNSKQSDQDIQNKTKEDLKIYFQKEFSDLKIDLQKNLSESRENLINLTNEVNKNNNKDILEFKDKIVRTINEEMERINKKVDDRLGEGFEKTNKTFNDVVTRLALIDKAQKDMEKLSNDVISLSSILTDKKSRGTFGEVNLYQILYSAFGDNKNLYETQKKLSNEMVADALIHAPEPLGNIVIDAKFPLENYQRMIDKNINDEVRKTAEKEFKINVKKHIKDIHNKYIITGETTNQAIMFIPAEAIFAEINARHQDLIDYSYENKVWVTSPTTLMATLTIIQSVIIDIERNKYAKEIDKHLKMLYEDFKRYSSRWDKLKKHIDTVQKSAEDVHITSKKIDSKFYRLYNFDQKTKLEIDLLDEGEDHEPSDE